MSHYQCEYEITDCETCGEIITKENKLCDYHEIEELKEVVKDLKEALEFYAHFQNWIYGKEFGENGSFTIKNDNGYVDDNPPMRSCVYSGGRRARETLLKHKEILDKIGSEK